MTDSRAKVFSSAGSEHDCSAKFQVRAGRRRCHRQTDDEFSGLSPNGDRGSRSNHRNLAATFCRTVPQPLPRTAPKPRRYQARLFSVSGPEPILLERRGIAV